MYNYHEKYLFTRMPVNKRLKLWCKDDMVRAIGMVRDGVPTREAADTCNVPRTTLRRHLEKGDYTVCQSLKLYDNDAIIYQ